MIAEDRISPVSILDPHSQTWGQITGACLEDGHLRLIWVSHDKKRVILMAPDTVQTLFNCFKTAPF